MSLTSMSIESDSEHNVFARPLSSSTIPLARWERKAKEKQGSGTGNLDRFITSQNNSNISLHNITNENTNPNPKLGSESHDADGSFKSQLAQSLFEGDDLNCKILACKKKAPKPTEGFQNSLRVLYTANQANPHVKRAQRYISHTPERILDAPELIDDYYLNLMDWSSANMMAVSLGPCVYLWDPSSGGIDLLFEAKQDDDYVSAVSWMGDGSHLAMGMSNNEVLMWDVAQKKQVRSMKGHSARVGSLAWNNHILSSGSRDSAIFNHDVRIAQHHIQTWKAHTQEVCGLKWSPDGTQLASGSNDNTCCIWDSTTANNGDPRFILTESAAAVKALAWSPHDRNFLATGSGTADRHIRFYDTLQGSVVNSIDTGSQVCSLQWNPHEREMLSSHGYSENQLTIWKCPSMVKVAELTGHTSRVLHTALSADGTTVCSAAADETLRFWKVFDAPAAKKETKRAVKSDSRSSKLAMSIR